ncbi:FMN-binding negative transcriptional regulator [Comamonas sp. GB3 AK4-5]|uniref:FMN-binding negative transcriptional regulator n=1 Tax=Comamonas sp. GB3 AK4-5 TaxID=3231487 RepID=UPI00351E1658
MYNPPHFAVDDAAPLQALIQQHPLGMLVLQTEGQLDAHHLPFWLRVDAQGQTYLQAHVARANPLWQQLSGGGPVLVVFRAEQAYVSPNWYPSKHEQHRLVPTWNYRVVHAHGQLTVHDDEKFLRAVVGRLTQHHEALVQQQSPQAYPAWKMADAAPDALQQMLGAIVGLEIAVSRLEGKFKISQNRLPQDRLAVADQLQVTGQTALAQHMRDA